MYIDIATANSAVLGTNRILLNAGHADSATHASTAAAFDHDISVMLSGDVTGTASSNGSSSWALTTTTKYMTNLGRQTSMNIDPSTTSNRSKFFIMQADANTSTGKPTADGYVLTACWDTTAGYAGQIAFGHNKDHPWLQIRENTQKVWGNWVDVITTDNFNGKIEWAAWTAGTTEGPKANLKVDGVTKTSAAIPAASASASGIVTIGTQTFHGAKTFETAGFNYSGIEAGSDNADRVVWFAYNGQKGRPVYDNDFTYNPSNNQLKAGIGTFNSSLSVINDASNTTYDALAYFRSRGTNDWTVIVDSNGKDYGLKIDSNGNNAFSIINGGRANMNTIIPNLNKMYTLGNSSYYWNGAFIANGGNIHWQNLTNVYTGDPAWVVGSAERGLHRLLPLDNYGVQGQRLCGIAASCITIEQTTNGTTWTDITANYTDAQKRAFFDHSTVTMSVAADGKTYDNYSITNPDATIAANALTNHGIRITIDVRQEKRYGWIDAFMLRFGCAGGSGASTYNKATTMIETYDCYYDKVDGVTQTDAAHSHGAWETIYKEENVAYNSNDTTRCIYPKRQIYMDGANNRNTRYIAYVQKIRFTLLVPTWITAYRYYPRLIAAYAFGTNGQASIDTAATGRVQEFSRFMAQTGRPFLIESWTSHGLGFDSDLLPRQRVNEGEAIKTTDIHYLGTSGRRWYGAYINQIHGLDIIADLRTSSTANSVAYSYLIAGNSANVNTTSAHSEGRLRLYSAATAYHELAGLSITTNRIHTLPDLSGWLVSTGDTSSKVGDTNKPIYIDTNGQAKACSYTLSATINTGTTGNLAYYSGTNAISPLANGTAGQVMQTGGSGSHSWQTVSWADWTAGTADAGPKANLKIGSTTFTSKSIPVATSTASGVMTATDQTLHGIKTFETGLTVTGSFTGFSQTAWTAGTTAGPVPNYKIGTTAITGLAVPAAAAGASGIVTTAAQQFDGDKTFKGHIYTQANNTYNIGAEAKRFQTLYLSAALYMGATTFKAYNSAVQGTYICPGGIGLSNTAAGQGLYLRGGAEQYARFYIQTIGVKPTATTTNGTTTYSGAACGEVYLELGNGKVYGNSASGVDHNARGRIRFYGTSSGCTDLLAQNPTTNGRAVYLPNADHADPILMPTYDLSGSQDLNTKYNAGIYCIEGGSVTNYPTGSTAYANLIVIPYRKPQGNTKSDYALQIYGHSLNRLWFRGSDASSWRAWREFAHIAANTKTGSDKKGVYVAADGTITACSYELNAGTNAGTQYQLAYYSTTVAISSTSKIATDGTYLSLTDTTDATKYDGSDGVLRVKGGISIAKSIRLGQKLYLGANTASAADADSGIHIWDSRDVSHLPNTFGDQTVLWYFDNGTDDTGRGSWSTIMHLKGWTQTYAAHQMSFNATDGTGDGNIYHRTGSSNAWKAYTTFTNVPGTNTTKTWRKLLDDVNINETGSPFCLTEIKKSLKVTQSWLDTGIAGNNIPENGSYIIQVYVHSGTANTFKGSTEYYTGAMSWFAGTCDNADSAVDADEIVLHKAGGNSLGQNLYLRTIRVKNGAMKLQIKASQDTTVAANIYFKFRKII